MENKSMKIRMIRAVSIAALAAVLSAQTCMTKVPEVNKQAKNKVTTANIKEVSPIAGAILVQKTMLKAAKTQAKIAISESQTTISKATAPDTISEESINTENKGSIKDEDNIDNGFVMLHVDASEDMQRMIYDISKEYGLDYTFVAAIIKKESNFQPNLISSSGDYGLMQINKTVHKKLRTELGITDFLDPEQNVRAGCYILSGYVQKYKYENLALMAYNCGENSARALWNDGVWSTKYSRKVMAIQKEIEA